MNQAIQAQQVTVLSSPLPGKIVKILAREGERVAKGQRVFIVETMKMLQELRVARNGKIGNIRVKEGDCVVPNSRLADIF